MSYHPRLAFHIMAGGVSLTAGVVARPFQEEARMVVKRVSPLSCAKIAGLLYAIMGLIFGAFVSLFGVVGAFAAPEAEAGMIGALFGIGAVVLLPIFYGCLGFFGALITAALYNALASVVGGVEIDVA
jgi:hypothetical protein